MTENPPRRFSERAIWVDATGIVRWGPQPFTGVQRVEFGLIRAALRRPDVGVAVMAGESGVFRPAGRRLLACIDQIGSAQTGLGAPAHRATQFLDVDMRYGDNETARRLAQALAAAPVRKGFAYRVAKLAFRTPIRLRTAYDIALGLAWRALTPLRPRPTEADRPFLIVSHEVNRHPAIVSALSGAGLRQANIVYDLIPVLQPELTLPRYARGMAGFFRRILSAPDPIIAISEATRDDLLRWSRDAFGAESRRDIAVCPLGSTLRDCADAEKPIPVLDGRTFAMFCSTIDERKDHRLLVEVWRRLAETQGADGLPDLALIGRRGTGWAALHRELEATGAARGRVHVLHDVDDRQLRWAYRRAALALFPSRAEGWGLGVSEALAYGVPVIHSDIAVLREAAQGLMPAAPPGDAAAWTALLGGLFADPGRIAALRAAVAARYRAGAPDDFASGVFAKLTALRD